MRPFSSAKGRIDAKLAKERSYPSAVKTEFEGPWGWVACARAVTMAITRGVGWLPAQEMFSRLERMKSTEIANEARDEENAWAGRLGLRLSDDLPHPRIVFRFYSLSLEQFKRKATLCPQGTEFTWIDTKSVPGPYQCQIVEYLESIGMKWKIAESKIDQRRKHCRRSRGSAEGGAGSQRP